jgi:hypothetical protein
MLCKKQFEKLSTVILALSHEKLIFQKQEVSVLLLDKLLLVLL